MARQQAAGSMIVDQLRDRIVSGLYLGRWSPGERLPSIRDVADAENVDRKTAAAAYRRLQMEGLVRVRPRSGVYLRSTEHEKPGGPLERLHRRWLENAYEGARAIGLDTATMLRLIQAVAHVERQRIPVIEQDGSQAEAIADEVSSRLGINTIPVTLDHSEREDDAVRNAPFFITTPYHGAAVRRFAAGRPVVEVSCAREVVDELRRHAATGRLLVLAPTAETAERVRSAVQHGEVVAGDAITRVQVEHTAERARVAATQADVIIAWPGTPRTMMRDLESHKLIAPTRCVADESVIRVRSAILDAAMRVLAAAAPAAVPAAISMSSGDGARPRTVVLER